MKQTELIGKTITFNYSSESYDIEVISDTQIKWTRTRGETTGVGDTENYAFTALTDNIIIVTWIEADGLGLSNVLKFSDLSLTTHANMGRDVFENTGSFEVN